MGRGREIIDFQNNVFAKHRNWGTEVTEANQIYDKSSIWYGWNVPALPVINVFTHHMNQQSSLKGFVSYNNRWPSFGS